MFTLKIYIVFTKSVDHCKRPSLSAIVYNNIYFVVVKCDSKSLNLCTMRAHTMTHSSLA